MIFPSGTGGGPSLIPRQLPPSPMLVFARRVEHAFDAADTRNEPWATSPTVVSQLLFFSLKCLAGVRTNKNTCFHAFRTGGSASCRSIRLASVVIDTDRDNVTASPIVCSISPDLCMG